MLVVLALWVASAPAGTSSAAPLQTSAQRAPATPSSLSIEAKAQPGTIGQQEETTYVVTIEGASLAEINLPLAPDVDGLIPKSRQPVIEQDLVRSNGRLRRTVAFQWTYRPQRTGTMRFAPVSITINGQTYRTGSATVRALPRPRYNPAPPHSDTDALSDSDDIFIEATPSDKELYQGEQSVVSYRLFYRNGLQLRQSRLAGSWDAPGFWREELDVPPHPDVGTTQRQGKTYKTLLLKRVAVFPTRTGSLSLSPLEIETHARRPRQSRGLLGRLFSSGRTRELNVTSDSVHLRVRPLPPGAPPSFHGTVGTFRLDLSAGQTRTRVGEATELTLQVSGYGNLATLEAPSLEVPSGVETYAPTERLSIDRDGDRVRGTKTFTYTLVPQKRGTYEIPPLAFSFFAPDAERYQTLRTRPVTIHARGSATGELSASSSELPPGDLAGPLTRTTAWTRLNRPPLYRQVWPYVALVLPTLLAAALLAWRRRAAHASPPRSEASPTARKRLERARRHLKQDQPRRFYEEIERALRAFVGQQLHTPPTGQTHRQLRAAFDEAGVAEDTQQAFFELLAECERGRFAPSPPEREALKTASERAHRLVAALDESLRAPASQPPPARA